MNAILDSFKFSQPVPTFWFGILCRKVLACGKVKDRTEWDDIDDDNKCLPAQIKVFDLLHPSAPRRLAGALPLPLPSNTAKSNSSDKTKHSWKIDINTAILEISAQQRMSPHQTSQSKTTKLTKIKNPNEIE